MNPKQLRFCQEYIIDLNGTQAAIRAGYSAKTANEQSARLLAKVSIQEKIKELQSDISEKLEITAEWVIKELIDNNKEAKKIKKYGDSNKALELIGRHLAMFTDKKVLDVNNISELFTHDEE